MLNIHSGDRILYVGDHMYSDVVRSKRTLGWRTCLVIPELENELRWANAQTERAAELYKLQWEQYASDERIEELRHNQAREGGGAEATAALQHSEVNAARIKDQAATLFEEYDLTFNAVWGQLFKAGSRESRFAGQVTDYACLYTSRASNLRWVSANRPFRPVPRDYVQHETIMQHELVDDSNDSC
jgi:5'-nucleotidase